MSKELSRSEIAEQTLSKLEDMIAQQKVIHHPQFTDKEAEVLRLMVRVWVAWETMGAFGGVLRRVALWILFMIGTYVAIKNGFVDFIQEAVTSKKS